MFSHQFRRYFLRTVTSRFFIVILCCVLSVSGLILVTPKTYQEPIIGFSYAHDYGFNWSPQQNIDRLRTGHSQDFDWKDWVNLHKTELWESHELDAKHYPNLYDTNRLSDIEMPLLRLTTQHEQAMIGQLYVKFFMPAPRRVIAMAHPKASYSELMSRSDKSLPYEQFIVNHIDGPVRNHRQFGHEDPNWVPTIHESPTTDLQWVSPPQARLRPKISESLFDWDPRYLNSSLHLGYAPHDDAIGDKDKYMHMQTLYLAHELVESSPKHFQEVNIARDPLGLGTHYDWRFFRGVASHNLHHDTITHLTRTWAQFADLFGFTYWFAHGSLLGWWWNGLTMPWDSDNDIQMPIQELNRLAREFNGSLIVQNTAEGNHSFYIDISPWYVQRERGNQNNVIDGRFIDVHTGAYIDITGLAHTNNRDKVNCKNWHIYSVEDLIPPRRVLIEGSPSYIPNNFNDILLSEYRGFQNPKFGRWSFNRQIQLWELEQSCDEFSSLFDKHSLVLCVPQKILKQTDCAAAQYISAYNTCDQLSVDRYMSTRELTSVHVRIKDSWLHPKQAVEQIVPLLQSYYPPPLLINAQ